ncbi:MAG: HD domain-containing protein [Deltaproteobacteria bacterium]|uniref:HD domain-containing protein n=1 Tax=Candidatus Zymogenus saltonus TaxID=2844893 RepID=A0A9D8KE36_9DELT|nr:HD domain-containing protein [Candidatus Zymogenus saltonus]
MMDIIPLKNLIPEYDRFHDFVLSSGCDVYLVGGAIRDYLIGLKSSGQIKDFDFIVFGDSQKFAKRWATELPGTLVVLDEEERIYRVVRGKAVFDFSSPKGDNHISDAEARDFTINTLRVDIIEKNTILDPTNTGRNDIEKGIIRTAHEDTFKDDPLRLVRAFRFMATLPGFKIEEETLNRIGRYKGLIKNSAKERLGEEFVKLFLGSYSYSSIVLMDQSRLLGVIFPEVETMRGVSQNRYHSEDVWGHSLLCLKEAESIVERPEAQFPERGDFLRDYLNASVSGGWTRSSLIKFTALFHDAGKPETKGEKTNRSEVNGMGEKDATFYGHENRGANIFKNIAKRIILGRKVAKMGTDLIKNHMRLLSLASAEKVSERGIGRLLRDVGKDIPGLLILGLADTLAGKMDTFNNDRLKRNRELIENIFSAFDRVYNGGRPILPLISGREIMALTGIEEGIKVGKLKSEILLSQTTGTIRTKEEAICLLSDLMEKRNKTK